MSPRRLSVVLTLPLVLLTVALLEDLITYKVHQHVRGLYVRVGTTMVLKGALFSAAAVFTVPLIKDALTGVRQGTRRGFGTLGLWLFYVAAYGALFWAYLLVARRGPAALLPAALR